MSPDDIKAMLGDRWLAVESYIKDSLDSDIGLLQSLNGKILSHGGKQLRPLLSMLVAMACSGGKVLVGDYWLVKAMGLILSADNHGDRVLHIFSRTLSDLAEGEMLQLQKAGTGDTSKDDYIRIIYNKTASLFVAACLSAAISVGAPAEIEDAVTRFATALGLAFQIRDDIFDYSQDKGIGKPVGVDVLEQKITLPLLGALQSVPERTAAGIRKMVADIHEHPGNRDAVMDFVKEHNGVSYAEKELSRYISDAVTAIEILPESSYRDMLAEVARYVGDRSR